MVPFQYIVWEQGQKADRQMKDLEILRRLLIMKPPYDGILTGVCRFKGADFMFWLAHEKTTGKL